MVATGQPNTPPLTDSRQPGKTVTDVHVTAFPG